MILALLISLLLAQEISPLATLGRNDKMTVISSETETTVISSGAEGGVEKSYEEEEASIDIGEIIFEHIGDEYEWHITEWKGKPVAIPLPCIVIENGIHVFTVHHAAENGYTLNGRR